MGTLHSLHRPVRRWSQSWSDNQVNDQLVEWITKPQTRCHSHTPSKWFTMGVADPRETAALPIDYGSHYTTMHYPVHEDNYYISSLKCVKVRKQIDALSVSNLG